MKNEPQIKNEPTLSKEVVENMQSKMQSAGAGRVVSNDELKKYQDKKKAHQTSSK
jgi:hypothetical protein